MYEEIMKLLDLIQELLTVAKTLRSPDPEVIIYNKGYVGQIMEVVADDPDHSDLIVLGVRLSSEDYEDYVASKD